MTRIKGQSEAARNARLDRATCPTHGLYMYQIVGYWYPIDDPPFTLVECSRSDCDVICKSLGPDGPVSEPLSEAALHALHDRHGVRWDIEYFTHFMRKTALDEARKRRDAGVLSEQDYAALETDADHIKTIAHRFIVALDAKNREREQ